MPDSPSHDHDQRLKVLLKEFIEQFFLFKLFAARLAKTYGSNNDSITDDSTPPISFRSRCRHCSGRR